MTTIKLYNLICIIYWSKNSSEEKPYLYEYLALCLYKLMEPGGREGAYGLGNEMMPLCKFFWEIERYRIRGLQRDVVFFSDHSALEYESQFQKKSQCRRIEGVAGSQPMSTAVHITWHGAQINFGDLPPYFTYMLRILQIMESIVE